MPNRQPNLRIKRARSRQNAEPAESSGSEVVTIAWTVSVTGVLIADLMVVALHLVVRSQPVANAPKVLELMTLLAAAVMGGVSLALLAVVWRTRRVKPPRGYIVFAMLAAIAPIVAVAGRLFL